MKITFNKQEHELLKQFGHKFREQTGKEYSTYYIMSILTNNYEENLARDLAKVMDRKLVEAKELKAQELGTTE